VLTGDDPVAEWTRGSLLRPLLAALDADIAARFYADYSARIAAAYPRRADGTTLFPFRRLFIVARRPG
jgi:trans-aconitate 2-methyltransferase